MQFFETFVILYAETKNCEPLYRYEYAMYYMSIVANGFQVPTHCQEIYGRF